MDGTLPASAQDHSLPSLGVMDSILPECFSLVMYHALAGALPCPLHGKPIAPVTYPITVRGEPMWITSINANHATVRDHTAVRLWFADLRWAARRLAQLTLVSLRWRAMLSETWRGLHEALLVVARTERVANLPTLRFSYTHKPDVWRRAVEYMIRSVDDPVDTPFDVAYVGTLRHLFNQWRAGFVCSVYSSTEHLALPVSASQEYTEATMDSPIFNVFPWPTPAAHRDVSLRILREQEDAYREKRAIRHSLLEALGPDAHCKTLGSSVDISPPSLGYATQQVPRRCERCHAACFVRISQTPKNPNRSFWVCPFRCRNGAWIAWVVRGEVSPPPTVGAMPSEFSCARCRATIDPYEQGGLHTARYGSYAETVVRCAVSTAILAGTYVCEQCLGR